MKINNNIISLVPITIAVVGVGGVIAVSIPGILSILGSTALKHTGLNVLAEKLGGAVGGGVFIAIGLILFSPVILASTVVFITLLFTKNESSFRNNRNNQQTEDVFIKEKEDDLILLTIFSLNDNKSDTIAKKKYPNAGQCKRNVEFDWQEIKDDETLEVQELAKKLKNLRIGQHHLKTEIEGLESWLGLLGFSDLDSLENQYQVIFFKQKEGFDIVLYLEDAELIDADSKINKEAL